MPLKREDIQEFYELTVCENQTSGSRPHTPAQKYRYQDDETLPADPSPGHMTHGRSTELSHTHLDGYTHPAALTVRTHTHTRAHTHTHTNTLLKVQGVLE
ncbi:Disks large like 4 [Dissostichus eleginoides]|uniref:Disks large like 4 n=1 Tax=Dissostichus eleginoides TaxID=100907 RepID=A0AAD9ET25_DISEL|nr:Disks large like 4 [Dissostichus eleginoides]